MNKLLSLAVSAALGLALAPAALAAGKPVSLAIVNAKVVTMDGALHVYDNGTLIIDGGNIVAVGDAGLERDYAPTQTIDAHGDIAMPGMINAHNHIAMMAFRGLGEYRTDDRLRKFFFPLESKMLDRQLINVASRQAAMELAVGGVTTVVDMYYHEDEVAKAVRDVGIRGVLGETVMNFPVVDAPQPYGGFDYAVDFIKQFKGDPLITPAFAPHAPYSVSPQMLTKIQQAAEQYDVPVLMHLAEPPDEWERVKTKFPEAAKFNDELAYLDSTGILSPRLLAAHVLRASDADIALLKARDVGVSHNPKANTKGHGGLSPALEMVHAGMDVGLGTDGPLSGNQMDIVSVMGYAKRVANIRHPEETTFKPPELVTMATIGGARALKMDKRIGSLEVGKAADVILIDTHSLNMQPMYDVYAAIVYQANAGDIHTTIVNGRIVARDGKVLTIDLDKQRQEWGAVTKKVSDFSKTLDY
ncbi:Cytosine/adenosine deaminase [Pseudoxanthomonas sp. GM95]|uniref:amidohydrolase n=1 Tax=Pseudoxanthomonas sp. GM95 TaxID=1881043 RepID=UPI0008ACDA87|nr:amidohydrolase [Pseudoxanthomonas sp. GM95]SEM19297.1 Cytosine/adenosine deaminase [Pseudoxanthomonas sp. GM95]